jgi:hypothetical protein
MKRICSAYFLVIFLRIGLASGVYVVAVANMIWAVQWLKLALSKRHK